MCYCSNHRNHDDGGPTRNLRRRPEAEGWELMQERLDGMTFKWQPHAFKNPSEPMAPATIAKFSEQMRELLWMLDVVLLPVTPASQKLFLKYFKTTEFQPSIMFLLRKIREYIVGYFCPDSYDDEVFQCKPIHILANKVIQTELDQEGKPDLSTNQGVTFPCLDTITLNPTYWNRAPVFQDFHLTQLEPTRDLRDEHTVNSTAGILLHELVHLISARHFGEFISASGCNGSVLNTLPVPQETPGYMPGVHDLTPEDVALPQSFSDGVVMLKRKIENQQQRHQPDEGKRCCRSTKVAPGCLETYGTSTCMQMAQLDRGAIGALFTAESYNCWVTENAYAYLNAVLKLQQPVDSELEAADNEMRGLIKEHGEEIWKVQLRNDRIAQSVGAPLPPQSIAERACAKLLSSKSRNVYARRAELVKKVISVPPEAVNVVEDDWWK